MNQKIKESEHLNIIKLYEFESLSKIAKRYRVSRNTILSILKKYNVKTKVEKIKESQEDIVRLYYDGFSSIEIANMYYVSKNTILNVLHRNNVIMRDAHECHRIYSLDEHYFDEIDTSNKAYILGLFYADGYNDGKGHVSISLQERDVDILNKIKKEINTNIPLNFRNFKENYPFWQNQYRLYINSTHVSKMLEKHGMIKCKSLTIEFPYFLSEDLYSHFIRGFLDGDGNISNNSIGFCSASKIFINSLKNILEKKCNIKFFEYMNSYGSCFSLTVHKREERIRLLNYLYKDADLYLNRKYDSYLKVLNNVKF